MFIVIKKGGAEVDRYFDDGDEVLVRRCTLRLVGLAESPLISSLTAQFRSDMWRALAVLGWVREHR